MRPALFDTSIYITSLRSPDDALVHARALRPDTLLWLSAVVLAELYAGADDLDRPILERLQRDFDGARRILVPNVGDWSAAGECLLSWDRLAARSEENTSELQSP